MGKPSVLSNAAGAKTNIFRPRYINNYSIFSTEKCLGKLSNTVFILVDISKYINSL